jgi:hypothetical protein
MRVMQFLRRASQEEGMCCGLCESVLREEESLPGRLQEGLLCREKGLPGRLQEGLLHKEEIEITTRLNWLLNSCPPLACAVSSAGDTGWVLL